MPQFDWVAVAVPLPPGMQQVRRGRGRSIPVYDRWRAYSRKQRQRQQAGRAEQPLGWFERGQCRNRSPARLDGLCSQAVGMRSGSRGQ
jgi:hypothetical protein